MAAYGQRVKLRLFLEGIEVPVVSADINVAPNSPVIASIQIPPLQEATQFFPRTLVHLFFLDELEAKLPYLSPKWASNPNATDPSKREKENNFFEGDDAKVAHNLDNTKYKLLFVGEVMGFTWNKQQSGRALILNCADPSNYWDYALQSDNTGIFGPGRAALFSGSGATMFTDFLSGKGSIITRMIASGRCNSYPDMEGLAAGIIRVIESIGGIYYPNEGVTARDKKNDTIGRVGGQNVFFSIAELRLHITQMITASENDKTSRRLMQRDGWAGLFGRRLQGLGGQVSIRKALNSVSAVIFHEMYGQSCPYYLPGDTTSTAKRVTTQTLFAGPAVKALKDTTDLVFEAVTRDLIPKTFATPLLTQPTQSPLFADSPSKTFVDQRKNIADPSGPLFIQVQKLHKAIKLLKVKVTSLNLGDTVLAPLTIAESNSGTAISLLQGFNVSKPEPLLTALKNISDALAKVGGSYRSTSTKTVTKKSASRLNQQIFRPDIWFGSPPRCNVLFPENYDSLAYRRAFLEEPTRLLLKTNDEFFGEDFLFDKLYFAPSAPTFEKDKARMRDLFTGKLFDHELFTGILPVFEKMGEFNTFASSPKTTSASADKVKAGYAQRAANFIYFKHRFNSRQMSVTGKFNPYIACGFPGLIMDRYIDQVALGAISALKERAFKLSTSIPVGVNFLGNFTAVQHSVSNSQGAGQTQITMSYPRQAEEGVEFLGLEDTEKFVKLNESAVRVTDVASFTPPKRLSLGPNGGPILRVSEVTDSYTGASKEAAKVVEQLGGLTDPRFAETARKINSPQVTKKLPLYQAKRERLLVPVGVPVTAKQLGNAAVTKMLGDPDRVVIFKAYRIEEEVPRYQRSQAASPIEDLCAPGWYDENVWSRAKIGETYGKFFGTGSINDPRTVTSPSLRASGASSSEDETLGRLDVVNALELVAGASIQDAVDFLTLTYSYVRQNALNVDEFITSYTWRPIASLVDLFGTSDLQFNDDGEGVVSGIEGFHSRAFGPYADLFGLAKEDTKDLIGLKRDSPASKNIDVRGRKYAAVLNYISAIRYSRGLLG